MITSQWKRLPGFVLCALGVCFVLTIANAEKTPLESVNPFIGTAGSRWFFFTPGAMPFGMAKPGPCTDAHLGVKGGWEPIGYDGRQNSIESFVSFREFQVGGVALMPTTGELKTVPGSLDKPDSGYRSRFDKQTEVAQPGYYSVMLTDYGVHAELTATKRVAFYRFTFPATNSHLIFDVGNQQGESGKVLDAFVRRSGEREIAGFVSTQPKYVLHYQPGAEVKMYFVARIDQAPSGYGTFRGTKSFSGQTSIQGSGAGMYLDFNFKRQTTVVVKMGLSYTSIKNARANLDAEADGLTFDQARKQSQAVWAKMLGRILVSGGTVQDRVKFYTGLYHVLLGRGICDDVNGNYPKNDGSVGQIPLKPDGTPRYHHFNTDSVWGSFWNLNQVWALAYPEITSQFIHCQLDIYRDCGWLPDSIATEKFVSGVGTDFMGLFVSSAYNWGIRDYNVPDAFAAVYKNETGWQNRLIGVGKADLRSFVEKGYVPLLSTSPPDFSGSTAEGSVYGASHTLEYCFSSAAAASFAKALGRTNDYKILMRQSHGWTNLFDSGTGFIRPKDINGKFIADFDPLKPWNGFQEGNSFQYSFYVPHDVAGLIHEIGLEYFRQRLAEVFKLSEKTEFGGGKNIDSFSGLQNHYNQGDEPSIEIPWLFNYCGEPWLTQYWVRRICDVFYGTDPVHGYGYGQDEDQGQIGGWYVLAAMGLFDVQGGAGSKPTMQLASPLFKKIIIQLDPQYYPGKPFEIEVNGNPAQDQYIQSASLNGKPLNRCWIDWDSIVSGGKLEVNLTKQPNEGWGATNLPPSMSDPK